MTYRTWEESTTKSYSEIICITLNPTNPISDKQLIFILFFIEKFISIVFTLSPNAHLYSGGTGGE